MPSRHASADLSTPALRWDVFCRVIDNFGDIGVCWRLACDLAGRGQRVRLWVDDPSALRWMAPDGQPGVEVALWSTATVFPSPADVVVEAFGCDPPPSFVAAMASHRDDAATPPPVWINLEYLSAEPYVERSHGLPSPQMSGPGRGLVKWFFYPGFTLATGGLLREPAVETALQVFDRDAWLAGLGVRPRHTPDPGERVVSLFCYPGAPVDRLVAALVGDGRPTLMLTAPGAATDATRAALSAVAARDGGALLRQQALPWLTQQNFDRLLWAADLNFVRGEDSWVRAQWAGKPFVWQAYPQHDDAQAAKVEAFLALALRDATPDALRALSRWTRAWNGLAGSDAELPSWDAATLASAGNALRSWRDRLTASADLTTRLLAFVQERR